MRRTGTARRLVIILAAPVLLFLTLVSWSFASPVGASPDDNFHLASIWCGQGIRDGLCEPGSEADSRRVPALIVESTCYAFLAEESAACQDDAGSGLAEADWLNTVHLYPPVFYGVFSVFASPDVATSTVVIRVVNSAFLVGLLSCVFAALPRRLRPALVISVAASVVPLGLFILASTNPSSWAYVSAATVWVSVLGSFVATGRRQVILSGLAVLCCIVGAGARADAAAFAVFGALIAVLLGLRRSRPLLVPLLGVGLVVVVSAVTFLTTGQSAALTSGLPNANAPLTLGQHVANLLNVPTLWFGVFGSWGLGWLDTLLPTVVSVLAFAVFAAAIFLGLDGLRARRSVALVLTFAALWAVPFVLLARSRALVGSEVQPRYLLPIMVILLGVASLAPAISRIWAGARVYVAAAALAFTALVSLHYNIRRYTTGVDSNAIDPGAGAEWWWTAAPSPLTIWVLGSAAFAALMLVVCLAARAESRRPPLADGDAASIEDEAPATAVQDASARTPVPVSRG